MDDLSRAGDDRTLSPLDAARESYLPGMAVEVLPLPISDEEIDRLPVHTAERLLQLHPDRYALACALFFGCPTMSGRDVCRTARVGTHTLRCIIEREERGRTAAEWAASAGARLRSLADMGMAAAADLMTDRVAVREAGIKGVATLIRESTHAHALLEGRLPGQQQTKPKDAAADYMAQMRAAQEQSIAGEISEGSRGQVDGEPEALDDGSEASNHVNSDS